MTYVANMQPIAVPSHLNVPLFVIASEQLSTARDVV